MLFWLKKFVSFWLAPLPFCVVLMAAGWWLASRRQRKHLGRGLFAAGALLLLLFSNKAVSTWLIGPLNVRYQGIPEFRAGEPLPEALAACRYVAVLGGGRGDLSGRSATNKLSPTALSRIVEAVRLMRVLPSARLIVSGPGTPSLASVFAQAAVSLGVPRDRIELVDSARDTEDESLAVKAIAGRGPVALVTSSWHMARAMALFRSAGVNALPCPVDFDLPPEPPGFKLSDLTFNTFWLANSDAAMHERLGYLWAWLRGKG